MEKIAEAVMDITSVVVDGETTRICYEGNVGKYGRVFATHNFKSNDANRNSGNFTGDARTIMDDGSALSATLQGIWRRDGGEIQVYSLDDASNGDQNFIQAKVDLLNKKAHVEVNAL